MAVGCRKKNIVLTGCSSRRSNKKRRAPGGSESRERAKANPRASKGDLGRADVARKRFKARETIFRNWPYNRRRGRRNTCWAPRKPPPPTRRGPPLAALRFLLSGRACNANAVHPAGTSASCGAGGSKGDLKQSRAVVGAPAGRQRKAGRLHRTWGVKVRWECDGVKRRRIDCGLVRPGGRVGPARRNRLHRPVNLEIGA